MSVVTVKPTGLCLALGMSKPPESLVSNPEQLKEYLTNSKNRLERELEGKSKLGFRDNDEFEKHFLGTDDFDQLKAIRQQLAEFGKPQPVPEPVVEEAPAKQEDEKARARWRKASSEFHAHKLFGQRVKDNEPTPGNGARIMELFDRALTTADKFDYDAAIVLLDQAAKLAKKTQADNTEALNSIARESAAKKEEYQAAFNMVVQVEDPEYGFDTDTDAKYFYLANAIEEDGLGTLKKSGKLAEMERIMGECAERKKAMKEKGATIDEIVSTVYKDVPKALWPNDVVKEVVLYQAVTAQIESEKELEEAEFSLADLAEKTETAETVLTIAEGAIDWAKDKFGEKVEKLGEALEVIGTLAKGISLTNSMLGIAANGLDGGEKAGELEEIRDNPVKEKIVEFQRNKAIVTCVNSLFDLGLSNAAEWVPVLNLATGGKDVLMSVAQAGYYFKNTLNLKVLEKGAKTDPRSAALLPLARLAREQKIALSDAALSAVSSALETAGKGVELAAITAPVGAGLEVAGKVVKFGGKAIIQGINWADAAKAAKLIEQAAGPPALRRAQIEVMKHSSKYAKVAVCHLAMIERDPWAIGHLENVGLERMDIDAPATTSKLIREYMALKGGGLLGDEQGEDQTTFGESLVGKAGTKIVAAAEWVRDKVVGRNTKIAYDMTWRPSPVDLNMAGWNEVREGAIAAGWYDSRPNLTAELNAYAEAQTAYNSANPDDVDLCINVTSALITALEDIQDAVRGIEAVANDKTTKHAGMDAFTGQWYSLAMDRRSIAVKMRSEFIDRKMFPGKTGEDLENAKKQMLAEAEVQMRREQKTKVANRKLAIDSLWDNYVITTPYVTCKLSEFPTEMKASFLRSKTLGFGDSEVSELVVEVEDFREKALARLYEELLASEESKLRANFTASAKTLEKIIVEALRTTCERLYDAKLKRERKPAPKMWTPASGDIVLDWNMWRKVHDAAKKSDGGWKQEENTGFTDALKAYQTALSDYNTEVIKPAPNPTVVEQKKGLILGSLDSLETLLGKFKPLTEQLFHHTGLIAYRQGMLELCIAERAKYSAPTLA